MNSPESRRSISTASAVPLSVALCQVVSTAKRPAAPRHRVSPSGMQPPTVVCSQLNRQQVVMVDQVLSFEVTADDDFGLKEIGIQWQGLEDPLTNPKPAAGETVIMQGSPEAAELAATASF